MGLQKPYLIFVKTDDKYDKRIITETGGKSNNIAKIQVSSEKCRRKRTVKFSQVTKTKYTYIFFYFQGIKKYIPVIPFRERRIFYAEVSLKWYGNHKFEIAVVKYIREGWNTTVPVHFWQYFHSFDVASERCWYNLSIKCCRKFPFLVRVDCANVSIYFLLFLTGKCMYF